MIAKIVPTRFEIAVVLFVTAVLGWSVIEILIWLFEYVTICIGATKFMVLEAQLLM